MAQLLRGPDIVTLGIGNILEVIFWLWDFKVTDIEEIRARALRRGRIALPTLAPLAKSKKTNRGSSLE